MEYRYQATSVTGFVQQLVASYLAHGYWFYVQGHIPRGKDLYLVDQKLIAKYQIGVSRQTRSRRKALGLANVHYLRYRQTFVLLATHGTHPFHTDESANIRDARKTPLQFMGYSISVQEGQYLRRIVPDARPVPDGRLRVRVQICRSHYEAMKIHFVERSLLPPDMVGNMLRCVPYEPYAPVRQQMLNILRLINEVRRQAGFEPVPPTVLRYKRAIVRPFDSDIDFRSDSRAEESSQGASIEPE